MQKVFPIQNDAACLYKWTWSTVFLNRGTTTSCHRCHHWEYDLDTMMDFHNHPGKISDREKMLKGEWPGNGCEYCRDIEAAGGISDRLSFVNQSVELIPKELAADPTATHVTPRLLEVYFNNVCNQSCIYCTPGFSSQIEQEVRKFGPSKHNWNYSNWSPDDKYELYKDKFWEWMKKNAGDLMHLQTLGGEPMYQKEFDTCLDFFDENPCPDLIWRIFTNGNHPPDKFREKIKRIQRLVDEKKIQRMDIQCSIDCWGDEVEYARYGLKMDVFEENMNTLLEFPGVGVLVHSTLTPVTLPTFYQLVEKNIEWCKRKRVYFTWNTVQMPVIFNPYHFGPHLVPYVDKGLDILAQYGDEYKKEWDHLNGIKQQMLSSEVNLQHVNDLRGFLDDIDVRRKLDWKKLYPQIDELMVKLNTEHSKGE